MARHSVIDTRVAIFSIEKCEVEEGDQGWAGPQGKRWRCTCGTVGAWWYAKDWIGGLEDSFLLEAWQQHFLNKRCRK